MLTGLGVWLPYSFFLITVQFCMTLIVRIRMNLSVGKIVFKIRPDVNVIQRLLCVLVKVNILYFSLRFYSSIEYNINAKLLFLSVYIY